MKAKVALGLCGLLAVVVVAVAAAQWGPKSQAAAQIALDQAQAAEGRRAAVFADVRPTLAACLRVTLWACATLAVVLALSAGAVAVAFALRRVRAAVELPAWMQIPQRPVLLAGKVYDPRLGSVDLLDEPHTSDTARALALAEAEARRLEAVASRPVAVIAARRELAEVVNL